MHDPYEPSLPLATVDPAPIAIPDKPELAMTPQQSRVDAVAALTTLAISKAATLQLTPDETARLTAEFPDADFFPGAAGKENLIYIQHSALRNRLNSVLGLGQWALIVRESWNEDFATNKGVKGVRVYCRVMMIVRGAYVGEAVGDMDYYPSNGQQNFGDAFEGSKTAAFRRCAKEFGIGLQAWDRHFCDGWWQRKQGKPPQVAPRAPQPAPKPVVPPAPLTTEERKARLIASLKPLLPWSTQVLVEEGILMEGEDLEDISLTFVERTTPDQMLALIKTVKLRKDEQDQIPCAEASDQTSTQAGEPVRLWESARLPFNSPKNPEAKKGMTLKELFANPATKGWTWGLVQNFKAEPRTAANGKTYQPSADDIAFAQACEMWREEHANGGGQ